MDLFSTKLVYSMGNMAKNKFCLQVNGFCHIRLFIFQMACLVDPF